MAGKYIVRKRRNTILYSEFFIAAIVAAIFCVHQFQLHPAIGLLIGIGTLFLLIFLFVSSRIFRYIFSILFSLGWAAGAFSVGQSIDKKSEITSWIFGLVAFAICLWAHYDHFKFIKDAKVYEYERQ